MSHICQSCPRIPRGSSVGPGYGVPGEGGQRPAVSMVRVGKGAGRDRYFLPPTCQALCWRRRLFHPHFAGEATDSEKASSIPRPTQLLGLNLGLQLQPKFFLFISHPAFGGSQVCLFVLIKSHILRMPRQCPPPWAGSPPPPGPSGPCGSDNTPGFAA